MNGGDTLYIKSGVYFEGIFGRIGTAGQCVSGGDAGRCLPNGTAAQHTTISAAPGHERKVEINNPTPVSYEGAFRYITYKGLIMNADRQRYGGSGSSVAIGGGCMYDGGYQCRWTDGVTPNYPRDFLFENNELKNGSKFCIGGFGTDSRYFGDDGGAGAPPSNNIFRNNDIHDCGSWNGLEHGIYQGGDTTVENDRISWSAGFCVQLQGQNHGEDSNRNGIIRNNLFWDCSYGYVMRGGNNQGYNNVFIKTGNPLCDPWIATQPGQNCFLGQLNRTSGGVSLLYSFGNLVANNTIVGTRFGIQDQGPTNSIYNNVCIDCTNAIPGGGRPGFYSARSEPDDLERL